MHTSTCRKAAGATRQALLPFHPSAYCIQEASHRKPLPRRQAANLPDFGAAFLLQAPLPPVSQALSCKQCCSQAPHTALCSACPASPTQGGKKPKPSSLCRGNAEFTPQSPSLCFAIGVQSKQAAWGSSPKGGTANPQPCSPGHSLTMT